MAKVVYERLLRGGNRMPVVDIPGEHYFGREELDHYLSFNVTSNLEKEVRTRPTR